MGCGARCLFLVLALLLAGCTSTPQVGPAPDERGDASTDGGNNTSTAREWDFATFDEATIRPGVLITMSQDAIVTGLPDWCTSNFVFLDGNGSAFLGMAGHCLRGPMGAEVQIEGAKNPATLAYNSFVTMDDVGEDDGHVRLTNDFAVVALHENDYPRLNPTVLHWGGPTGVANSSMLQPGDELRTYGNSPLRPGPAELDARQGTLVATEPWWGAASWDGSPGVSGDSGSAVLTSHGEAAGVLTHLRLAGENPINPDDRGGPTGSNTLVYLDMALEYARIHAGLDLQLAVEDMGGPTGVR